MNIEQRTLSEEIGGTQRKQNEYRPLRIVNGIKKVVEKTSDTAWKKAAGAVISGVGTFAAIKLDGCAAGIGLSEVMGSAGGIAIGARVHFISGPEKYFRRRNAMQKIYEEKVVPIKEIARLSIDYSDKVDRTEVKKWFKKDMGEETHEHPERYHLMKAVIHDNLESKEAIIDKFMRAQDVAFRFHESIKYQRKIAKEQMLELIISFGLMTGFVNVACLLGHPDKAGWAGAVDDFIYFGFNVADFTVDRVKALVKFVKKW